MLHNSDKKLSAPFRRHIAVFFLLSAILMIGLPRITYADALDNTGEQPAAAVQDRTAAPQELSNRTVFFGDGGATPADFAFAAGSTVSITHKGLTYSVFTEEESVSALLHRLHIYVEDNELAAVDFSGEIPALSIVSDLSCQVVRRTATAYTTRYEASSSLAWGKEQVAQAGQDGYIASTYAEVYENGTLVSSDLLSTGPDTAVEEVIQYGTKSKNATVKVLDYDGGTVKAGGETLTYSKCLRMTGTAYTAGVGEVGTRTATGTTVHVGVVAVDRRVIPLGSRLYIETAKGSYVYGIAVAEDTGVRGNTIDLYMNSYRDCVNFGRRAVNVYILS